MSEPIAKRSRSSGGKAAAAVAAGKRTASAQRGITTRRAHPYGV
eukprot:COSAG02_NODE_37711_length_438_cov_1.067847_1_plen_43_part_01